MSRLGRKAACEEAHALDVRYLARKGWLYPGRFEHLAWQSNGEKTLSITIQCSDGGLNLTGDIPQRLELTSTPCHLGGSRPWFLCPDCSRRVAIVYSFGGQFSCRVCLALVYVCQRRNGEYAHLLKMQAIRRRLGSDENTMAPFPNKPRNMWRATYERLRQKYDQEEQEHITRLVGRHKFLRKALTL